jgi:pimeloyl-ACP methyl ester carboxylesterase
VLLHGGGLDDATTSWSGLIPRVAGHADAVAPDLPGYGNTPLNGTEPTVDGYTAWVIALLDDAQVRRCVLAGVSLGGAVALRTAMTAPERVAAVLACSPYGVDPRLPGGRLGWAAVHAPGLSRLTGVALRHSRRTLRRTLRTLTSGPVDDDLLDAVGAALHRPGAGTAWREFQRREVRWSGPGTVFGAELAALRCPVVLMCGERDLVDPAAVRDAAGRIPNGRFVLVPGARHWLPRDAPAAVAAELVGLLQATGC